MPNNEADRRRIYRESVEATEADNSPINDPEAPVPKTWPWPKPGDTAPARG